MSKTAREVIAGWIKEFERHAHGQPTGEGGHQLVVALFAAGFVIVPTEPTSEIIDTLDSYMPGPTTVESCEQAKEAWRKTVNVASAGISR